MVQIPKPINGPAIPYSRGRIGQCKLVNYTERVKQKYIDEPNLFTNPSKNWRPDQSIYGNVTIKDLLKRNIQKNKCCYCEKEILSSYEVEHYRPSGGYQQDYNGQVSKPGYYWLSYKWSNLFYSCSNCNNSKNAFFPLADNVQRAIPLTVDENCLNEVPLLINLVNEDPRDFIEFIELEPRGKAGNFERGELMIEAVGLRNNDMYDERISHWNKILAYKNRTERVINKLNDQDRQEEIDLYNQYLDEKCNPDFPFSTLIANNRFFFELNI